MTRINQTVGRLSATFQRPPANFGPIPAWWWSAEQLSHDRLEWQLRQLRAAGLREVMICSFGYRQPVGGFPPDDPPFFSDEWWSCFCHTATVAEEVGMRLWFWDHLGTFGDPSPEVILQSHPEFIGRELDRVPVGVALPVEAAVLRDDGGHVYFTVPRVISDRHTGLGFQEYMFRYDLYNQAATALLIDTLHGEYERRLGGAFGRVIAGSFHDELRPFPSWAEDLPAVFRARSGRDIRDCLPSLFDRAIPDAAARMAYHRALADVAEESFFKPLFRWHDDRGLIVVADQIRRARTGDPLDAQRAYHDYPRTHRWFNGIGNDHNGETKVHSSLAHLYEHPRVFLEAFHSSGWGVTLEDTLRWLLPWLQQGSTLYGPGTTWYGSIKGGWLEDGTPDTSWRQPYWRHYPPFAETIARLCWLFSQGHHVCDVALFYPSSAMQAELTVPDAELDASRNRMPWIFTPAATAAPSLTAAQIGRAFWDVAGGVSWRWQGTRYRDDRRPWTGVLAQSGQDFDIIDEDSLHRADVADGRLRVAGEGYRTLIFPMATYLPRRTLEQALALARDGGDVIFVGCVPRGTTEGGAGDAESRSLLDSLLGQVPAAGFDPTCSVRREHPRGGLVSYVPRVTDLLPILRERLTPTVSGNARALHRQVDGIDLFLIVPGQLAPPPPEREGRLWRLMGPVEAAALVQSVMDQPPPSEHVTVTVRQVGPVAQWDPFTGQIHPARVLSQDEQSSTVDVDLTSARVGIIVFGQEASQQRLAIPATTLRELDGDWDCELVQTQDNRYGDFAWPPSAGAPPVEVRRLDYLDGRRGAPEDEMRWDSVVCGFAPLVEISGPHRDPMLMPVHIDDWRPYLYSTRFGGHKNVGHQSGTGLQAVVPEQFVAFDFAEPGHYHFLRTEALVPETTRARLRVTSTGAIVAWVDDVEVAAGDAEVGVPVTLQRGANRLVLRIGEDEDRPLRGVRLRVGFHFLPADAGAPYGHPLPDVPAWLNLSGPAAIIPGLTLDPHPEGRPHHAWFRTAVPPGADRVTVTKARNVPFLAARLDGEPLDLAWEAGANASLALVDLPHPERAGRRLLLQCELPVGVLAANAFPEPLRFRCRAGRIRLGDWQDAGLGSYSGGVRYRAAFDLEQTGGSLWLDLGWVRGSVEVALNDASCGVRPWSPYRFDLTAAARPGTNHLAVTVFNTLGSVFGEGHPSPFGYRSQAVAGILGPVRLLASHRSTGSIGRVAVAGGRG